MLAYERTEYLHFTLLAGLCQVKNGDYRIGLQA
jgi:hypothetical protein